MVFKEAHDLGEAEAHLSLPLLRWEDQVRIFTRQLVDGGSGADERLLVTDPKAQPQHQGLASQCAVGSNREAGTRGLLPVSDTELCLQHTEAETLDKHWNLGTNSQQT